MSEACSHRENRVLQHPVKARVVAAALLVVIAPGCSSADGRADRQAAVAEVGAEVMPFDLDETTHIFTDTPTGGRQDVIADNPTDESNIGQIRAHLAEEASKFRAGDFSDPEAIHGSDMPGLVTLKERFGDITIDLADREDGAAIIYTTSESGLVDAIHDWFAAQTTDHGSHAEHNP